jgi:hypothetical protein
MGDLPSVASIDSFHHYDSEACTVSEGDGELRHGGQGWQRSLGEVDTMADQALMQLAGEQGSIGTRAINAPRSRILAFIAKLPVAFKAKFNWSSNLPIKV